MVWKQANRLPAVNRRAGYEASGVHAFAADFFDRQEWWREAGLQTLQFREELVARGARVCGDVFPGACDEDLPGLIGHRLKSAGRSQLVYWATLNSHPPVISDASLGTERCTLGGGALAAESDLFCPPFTVHHRLADAITRLALDPDLPPMDFLIVGDHMPPYFERDAAPGPNRIQSPGSCSKRDRIPGPMPGVEPLGCRPTLWHGRAMRLSPAILSAACLIGLTVAAPATAGAGAQTPSAPLREPLPAWLAGTWAMEKGAAWSDQVWTSTRGGIMLGTTRIGFGPDVESWAMMRIERRRDGSLILIVQPEAAASAEFPMVLASATSIEFANPRHDFPQRIRYRREGQLLMTEAAKLDGGDSVQTNYRPVESAPAD